MSRSAPVEVAPFAVDPEALRVALATLDDVALTFTHVRARLQDVLTSAAVWAADGGLRPAVGSLVEALDLSAQRGGTEAAALASRLALAAQTYGDVEQQAVVGRGPAQATRVRDAGDTSQR